MIIPVVRRVLEKNDSAAAENHATFDRCGITCVNLLGGAGCGKTALLEAVLPRLRPELRVAVLEGDLATTRDAQRIAALNVPVVQLLTEGGCHLTAVHVQRALRKLDLRCLDLLIIENVGNPVCPANFDLGEHSRIVVLSVTDGDDKPAKYPLLFRNANLVILSKADLLPHVAFDPQRAAADIRQINPHVPVQSAHIRDSASCERIAAYLRNLAHPTAANRPSHAPVSGKPLS